MTVPILQKNKIMNKKYHLAYYYILSPIFALIPMCILEYFGIPNVQERYQIVFMTASFLLLTYLIFRYDHCLITDKEFSRISYFIFKKTIKIDDIAGINFPTAFGSSPEARTLVVWDGIGRKIMMTDMAFTRPALADVVKTLIKINPRINLDKDSEDLISGKLG